MFPQFPKIPGLPFAQFGKVLHDYRLQHGLSVEELAAATNMAPSAIRAMEANQSQVPSKEVLKKLAEALHLDADERESLDLAATMSSPFLRGLMQPTPDAAAKAEPPVLPAAILVFLIADVRGYTFFTQSQGDEAAARLATKFAEIARSVAERWDGRLLELRGDEALVIFSSLRQALLAALALQTRFAEATEADPNVPLQVGIGLDVGEAVPVEDGYRGVALNRAARLCSLAAAGEILVTTGLVYVASKVEGIHFTEHSQAQLKGFETPVAVMRVSADQSLPPPAPPAIEGA
jgi:class 3 adenylate cyclase